MRLARFRRFASVLVVLLLAGLAAPALAVAPVPASSPHLHAAHAHAREPAHCCPDCSAAAASCAALCLGVGILPASASLLPAPPVPGAWPAARHAQPPGTIPPRDTDPPRPTLAR